MLPLVFLGGAITGAAGLLGAALWDKHRTESQYSPLLKSADNLDAEQTARQLNTYFFKAQAIYTKCNEIVIASSELIVTPIPLPGNNFLQKAANLLGSGANRYCRSWRESEMRQLKKEAKELYGRYRGVFERANQLATQKGATPIDLNAIIFSESSPKIDSSLENDNWDREFQELADTIREFIEKSCDAAERLIDILEGVNHEPVIKAITE